MKNNDEKPHFDEWFRDPNTPEKVQELGEKYYELAKKAIKPSLEMLFDTITLRADEYSSNGIDRLIFALGQMRCVREYSDAAIDEIMAAVIEIANYERRREQNSDQ